MCRNLNCDEISMNSRYLTIKNKAFCFSMNEIIKAAFDFLLCE